MATLYVNKYLYNIYAVIEEYCAIKSKIERIKKHTHTLKCHLLSLNTITTYLNRRYENIY